MEINFTPEELLFVYEHFKRKAKKLEDLKATPGCPMATKTLDADLKLYNSITKKLSDCEPMLLVLDSPSKKLK